MAAILELRGISKSYGTFEAVRSVSLDLERGSFTSLLGPSGCGKTTTLRLIAGFEQPSRGEIRLAGEPVQDRRPYERNVSTVFQSYALFPHLTVAGNIAFGLRQRGEREVRAKVDEALRVVRLAGKQDRLPAQLSGGERQRVALARSLVLEPAVLLLDEPLAALDLQLRKQMRSELKEIQRRAGIAFLFVTHDQEEALSMSDRVAVMNGGRIEQAGAPREVYLRPATRFVANFLGAVNWIGDAGVRPEALRLERGRGVPDECSREATVLSSMFLGNVVHVRVRTAAGEEATAELDRSGDGFEAGDEVQLSWARGDEIRPQA